MTGPLPDYLRRRMAELGITTTRGLAVRCGISAQTALRLLIGRGTPTEQTLRGVSDGLLAPLPLLRRLAGLPSGENAPFLLPAEADQLDERQRAVVLAMVRALLESSTERTVPAGPHTAAHPPLHAVPFLAARARDADGANRPAAP